MSPIIASDFTGLLVFFGGIEVALILVALFSFVLACRGARSAPAVSLPVLFFGAWFYWWLRRSGSGQPSLLDLLFGAAPLLALLSLVVWIGVRFGSRKGG